MFLKEHAEPDEHAAARPGEVEELGLGHNVPVCVGPGVYEVARLDLVSAGVEDPAHALHAALVGTTEAFEPPHPAVHLPAGELRRGALERGTGKGGFGFGLRPNDKLRDKGLDEARGLLCGGFGYPASLSARETREKGKWSTPTSRVARSQLAAPSPNQVDSQVQRSWRRCRGERRAHPRLGGGKKGSENPKMGIRKIRHEGLCAGRLKGLETRPLQRRRKGTVSTSTAHPRQLSRRICCKRRRSPPGAPGTRRYRSGYGRGCELDQSRAHTHIHTHTPHDQRATYVTVYMR